MPASLTDRLQQLDACHLADRPALLRRCKKIGRQRDAGIRRQQLAELDRAIERSLARVRQRRQQRPAIDYPDSLPVSQKKKQILDTIERHPVTILCGETGSGKTTQLPKMCLELGRGCRGMIGHTQPRRLAARAVATRLAEELRVTPGEAVGYKVRFSEQTGADTYIKVMTDGILLAECHHDPDLNQYDTLIIDEAHERSLNIDFLLGYLKRLLRKRKDLKLIITSATIDPERFSRHFDDAPIIQVSGRTYPVEVRYRPVEDSDGNLPQAIGDAVNELSAGDRGDILVFLSGERDIRETADYLKKHLGHGKALANTEILPLLARQSAHEQNRIFHPGGRRRIVLATNVAETSLTVPGIKYVIDSGLARISRYSWRSKVQRLPIEKISQAAADQRKGRCGRTSPGVCIRLYDEADFLGRDPFTPPEIKRTNLAAVILQMIHLDLGAVEDFPFVEAPQPRLVNDGYKLLVMLGALSEDRRRYRITEIGKTLARLPIDPQLARMLVEARDESSLNEVLIIVAALATQDVRERPPDKQQAADQQHQAFCDKQSDFVFYLNLWQAYHEARQTLGNNPLRKWCKQRFLSWRRMREWIDTHQQIRQNLKEQGFRFNRSAAHYEAIHRALLTGLPGNIGYREENREYLGARGRKFFIHPASSLFKKASRWIVSAQIVETSQVYARTNANIEPAWIEDKLAHLLHRHWSEAHWQARRGQVGALEQASLFGLLVYSRRRVNYGPIDPVEARRIFIDEALVNQNFDCKADFFIHNRQCIERIRSMEAKSRRLDILVDDAVIHDFYDRQIPAGVYNAPLFNRWYKTLTETQKQGLFLDQAALMQHDATHIDERRFPDTLEVDGCRFPLHYHFDTRHHRDGVTLTVPLALLDALDPQRCEWLVPGLLQDKMVALIRSLPKKLRKHFVPAPDFARACFEALTVCELPLCSAMGQHLKKITGVDVPYDAWQPERLDEHFFFNFRVIDDKGKTLAEGRDLSALKSETAHLGRRTSGGSHHASLAQENVSASVLDNLPERIEYTEHGVRVTAYPALVRDGKKVHLKALASRSQALRETRKGMVQLVVNALPEQMRYLQNHLPDIDTLCLKYATLGDCRTLKSDIVETLVQRIFLSEPVHDKTAFDQRLRQGRERLMPEAQRLSRSLSPILDRYREIRQAMKKTDLHLLDTLADIRQQLELLLPPHFICTIDEANLQQYPRYLQAISVRLEKARQDSARDRQLRLQIAPFQQDYIKRRALHEKNRIESAQLEHFRWMLEEFRVSLFAQTLKTRYPVSAKRLKKFWQEISDS